jgi:hypothetical protein
MLELIHPALFIGYVHFSPFFIRDVARIQEAAFHCRKRSLLLARSPSQSPISARSDPAAGLQRRLEFGSPKERVRCAGRRSGSSADLSLKGVLNAQSAFRSISFA